MKVPVVASKISAFDIFEGIKGVFSSRKSIGIFEKEFAKYIGKHYCFTVGSGKTGFYVILKVISELTGKKEVIMPAYTDGGLVAVIRRLGLEVVLCDISIDNFNIDEDKVASYITGNTLCILAVHSFGLPCGIKQIVKHAEKKEVIVIEDCAQSLGSAVGGGKVGSFGDFSFFSFARGKNMPTYTGGAVLTDSVEMAEKIAECIKELKISSFRSNIRDLAKITALSLAVKPMFYSSLYPFISKYKSTEVPENFPLEQYNTVRSKVASALVKKIEKNIKLRYERGLKIIDKLKENKNLKLPKISEEEFIAFNRIPIIVKQWGMRDEVRKKLSKCGIESSYMYERPIHKIYDLDYPADKNPFPNATYLAEHLITVPVHYLLSEKNIKDIVKAFHF